MNTNPRQIPAEKRRREIDRATAASSRAYGDALRAADGVAAERVALECLQAGTPIETLYEQVIGPAMVRIGCLWEEGALTVADEHLATAITHRVMASAYGASFASLGPRAGRIMLAAVEGQRHSVGLRMAADVLELAGYEVLYLGADVPLEALLGALASRGPDLLGLSSTLAPARSSLSAAVAAVRESFPETPILLGGQGVGEESLDPGRVTRAPGLEGLSALVAGLLAGVAVTSPDPRRRAEAPIRPPSATAGSPEERLLGAAAEAAELARSHARMAHSYRRQAYEDPITGGPNRRAFDDRLALLNDSPEAAPVTIAMLDLDDFKAVNDTRGHAAGDEVLRQAFAAISSCLRQGDFAARLGGDEFALLLAGTDLAKAREVAARLLEAIAGTRATAPLHATIGLAPLRGEPRRAMLDADLALYRGKAAGGDRVESSPDPPAGS